MKFQLNLRHNRLNDTSLNIGNWSAECALNIDLSENMLKKVPSPGKIPNITSSLILNHNEISSADDVRKYNCLENLELRNNLIDHFPKGLTVNFDECKKVGSYQKISRDFSSNKISTLE